MSTVDWTPIYKKYKGLWVALKDDEITVISSGQTLKETAKKATEKGFDNPIYMQVPKKLNYFVGITNPR